jgi:hypothetical protein
MNLYFNQDMAYFQAPANPQFTANGGHPSSNMTNFPSSQDMQQLGTRALPTTYMATPQLAPKPFPMPNTTNQTPMAPQNHRTIYVQQFLAHSTYWAPFTEHADLMVAHANLYYDLRMTCNNHKAFVEYAKGETQALQQQYRQMLKGATGQQQQIKLLEQQLTAVENELGALRAGNGASTAASNAKDAIVIDDNEEDSALVVETSAKTNKRTATYAELGLEDSEPSTIPSPPVKRVKKAMDWMDAPANTHLGLTQGAIKQSWEQKWLQRAAEAEHANGVLRNRVLGSDATIKHMEKEFSKYKASVQKAFAAKNDKIAALEKALKDKALKDKALKDKALKDKALKDKALKDKALKDKEASTKTMEKAPQQQQCASPPTTIGTDADTPHETDDGNDYKILYGGDLEIDLSQEAPSDKDNAITITAAVATSTPPPTKKLGGPRKPRAKKIAKINEPLNAKQQKRQDARARLAAKKQAYKKGQPASTGIVDPATTNDSVFVARENTPVADEHDNDGLEEALLEALNVREEIEEKVLPVVDPYDSDDPNNWSEEE